MLVKVSARLETSVVYPRLTKSLKRPPVARSIRMDLPVDFVYSFCAAFVSKDVALFPLILASIKSTMLRWAFKMALYSSRYVSVEIPRRKTKKKKEKGREKTATLTRCCCSPGGVGWIPAVIHSCFHAS
jgi:hypothetical protein